MNESITWRGESDNLIEAEYHPSDRTFRVKFRDSSAITYQEVTYDVVTAFLREPDKVLYLKCRIQGKFKPIMSEAEYTRGQEAIRLLAQFREHQREEHESAWSRLDTYGCTSTFDKTWIPAVDVVLDRK